MSEFDDSADIFANSSAETITEFNASNLSAEDHSRLDDLAQKLSRRSISPKYESPTQEFRVHSSDTSFVLTQLIRETCGPPERLYCPFCSSDFGFEFILKSHIKETHLSILHKILKMDPSQVEYHACPFCVAKFYIKELLPRHILSKHELNASDMFDYGSPSSYIQCYFCQHKVLRRHYKLLMVHIEKKHFHEFESYVYYKYSKLARSCDDLRFLDNDFQVTTQIMTPNLSDSLRCLRTDDKVIYSKKPVLIKPILKLNDPSSYGVLDSQSESDVELKDHFSALLAAKTACRKLRFDLPDSPLEETKKTIENKMKQVFSKKEKFRWKFFSKKDRNKHDSVALLSSPLKITPVKSSLESTPTKEPDHILRYKCGICCERFNTNGLLLDHLRRRHRGIKFKSRYHCGECNAKFFRNRFLIQHCCFHHSPLCLKNKPKKNVIVDF